MRIETYRRARFVDREEEIGFFVDWFTEVPQKILWVYGPKSSGKTTVIEYVVEKCLLAERQWWINSKYWVRYLNLRGKLISSYRSFLDALIVDEDVYEEALESNVRLTIGVIRIDSKKLEQVKAKKRNLFDVLFEEIERERVRNKIPILIIDEIQKLRDVYIKNGNGERELLKEFLNFCVRLTKETHLCHVVLLTSNTVFIERIYNDARMKETSRFKKIDHLSKELVLKWLQLENFTKGDIELIWDYYAGNISRLLEIIKIKEKGEALEEFLKYEAWLAYTEIVDYMARGDFGEEEIKQFESIAQEILTNGYFRFTRERREYLSVIEAWAEKEILFYEPLELRVTGNSRIYEKGMELLFS